MKIILAIDSFKGCLTSCEANKAAGEGVLMACPDAAVVQIPVSDGGEGFIEAFHSAIGGQYVQVPVCDPLMRMVSAKYLLKGKIAIIEIAQASGLTLLSEKERNPMLASSYGTGQLVADAVRRGAEHVIVGLGGSATSDAGKGMVKALLDAFSPQGQWTDMKIFEGVRFTIASDVKNPLCGMNGAAHVFAPQKGATPEMVEQLEERARQFAEESAISFGFDCSQMEGAGAAGGLGYAFLQYLGAACKSGIDLLLQTIGFDEMARDADIIFTGEGAADGQTLMGKLPMGVFAHSGDVPVCLIAGRVSDRQTLLDAGFFDVVCINPPGIKLEDAMRKVVAHDNICHTVYNVIQSFIQYSDKK